jgi:hypothetical protein
MVAWLTENIELVSGVLAVIGALSTIIWKSTKNWINLNYVSKKELEETLTKLEDSFADDLTRSSEAGVELSRFINTQLGVLQSAMLNNKGFKDESNDN